MAAISIIIPTHNRATMIARAVDSARQAAADVEVIIVDDASVDDTPVVCRKLLGIRYIRFDKNQGQAQARNTGIKESTAEFVAFLDDDDLLLPGALEQLRNELRSNPEVGFGYGRVMQADQYGTLIGGYHPVRYPEGDIFWEVLGGFCPCIHSFLVRKVCFDRVGYFDTQFQPVEDFEQWIRISERFHALARPCDIGVYRIATPSSGQHTSSILNQALASLRAQSRGLALPRAQAAHSAQRRIVRRQLRNSFSDKLVWSATEAIRTGARPRARRDLLTALQLAPCRALRPWTLKLLLASLRPTFLC